MKAKIPLALREQVWLLYMGDRLFKQKCMVTWCENIITPFSFECGHNVPESKGGPTDLNNLRPICSKCNRSMGDEYTIDQFSALSERRQTHHLWECFRFTSDSLSRSSKTS
jgi:5-methylcytosine-specific restriction endonuclease McrA